MKHVLPFVAASVLACALATPASSRPAAVERSVDHSAAQMAVEAATRLPPEGVNELKAIDIGGLKQWISVRGADRGNPMVLFLHGGPGWPMMPISWTYQRPWEDYFTVVQWDQRGGGKTGAGNPPPTAGELTVAQMQSDAEDVVRYLLKTYHRKKIILVGHSWGSILGVRLIQAHPEWFYAYVGVGQVVNMRRNEQVSYDLTMRLAQVRGDTTALAALRALAPYPEASGPIDWNKTGREREWVVRLGGMEYARSEDDDDAILAASPDYSAKEAASVGPASNRMAAALWPELSSIDFTPVTRLDVPVFIFAGRHDLTTPPQLAKEWFDHLSAPSKTFFWFDKSAHYVVTEEPGVALERLVRFVRPLAASDADAGQDDRAAQ